MWLQPPPQAAPRALPWSGAQRTTCTSNYLYWIPTAPITTFKDLLILEDRESTRYACYISGCKTFLERITGRSRDWWGRKSWTTRSISPRYVQLEFSPWLWINGGCLGRQAWSCLSILPKLQQFAICNARGDISVFNTPLWISPQNLSCCLLTTGNFFIKLLQLPGRKSF